MAIGQAACQHGRDARACADRFPDHYLFSGSLICHLLPISQPRGVGGTIRDVDAKQAEIGFARQGDAPTLALMSRDLIESGLGWTYRASRMVEMIDDPDNIALVTRDATRIVGFAIMGFGDERAHLALLAVRPTHWRRGIGRRMLTWLFESASVAGMASIHVELRADNTPAFIMYQAMGFTETLRVPRYYAGREPAVRMVRVLRTPGTVAPAWRPPARA